MCGLHFAFSFMWVGAAMLTPAWAQRCITATGAPLNVSMGFPQAVAVDRLGNIYFTSLHSVFKLDQSGGITRIAGNLQPGYSGDGGRATDAQLFLPDDDEFLFPIGLAVDGDGNVYVADLGNHRVRKISPDGVITTVAGNGTPETIGELPPDGLPATSVPLRAPQGLAMDSVGNLFVADITSIRKVSPEGTISTVAGNGVWGCTGNNPFFVCESGDGGPATKTVLVEPSGIAIDSAANLYLPTGLPRNRANSGYESARPSRTPPSGDIRSRASSVRSASSRPA